ncbi:MAG: tetratricopeptide repeat protein [Acidobacteriota bacterium]
MLLKSPVPLCLVAACKAGEETGAIAALRGAEGVTTLPLPRLAKRDVAAIASDMLAVSPVPAGFARFLARHSEGNAFFLCEYLRTAVDASVVARDARGRWQLDGDAASFEGLPLPRGLRELVSGRIAELDPAALEVLRWAAAIGREMGQALLAGIMGVSEDAIDEPIRKLLGKQLLEERGPLYRFGHEKVREIAYDALAPEIRATIHGRAARIIEALPDAARAAHLADLGRHWERAGEPRRALSPYLAAARAAGRVYALAEAERLYVAYLALAVPATLESVAIRCELAEEVLQLAGRATDALHHHGLAIAEARSLGDPGLEGRGLRGRGIVYWHLGRNAEALSDLRDALALHRAAGDRRRVGLTLASIGNVLHDQGELSDACRIYEDARRIHEEVGDDAGLLAVLGYLAVHAHDLGDLDLAVRRYEECIALARASGKRPIEAATLGNLAVLEFDRGRSERSAELLAAALAIARDVGARRLEGIVLANLANLEIDCGNKERGRALYEEALAIHREVGDLPYEAAALIGIGTHLLDSGRMDDARRTLEEARRLQRDLHDRRSEGSTNVVLARLERLTGKIAVARSLCDDAIAIFRESDDRLGLGKALCEAGHQSLASGTDADRELAEARAIAAALGVGAGSLGAKIERLAAAERASREGRTVVRGEDPATIASGLLQAISG